ncbi:MAG: hypothetical protein A2287_00590 [Candidatus Melainabacteria bacterium RIFOXYA12_FULL_32_12]|nr:MAG: hypothetical protein A2287_00590 [Candidatus Melainabacteria bacterium RIFOXYA12_FULL_32_12]
MDNDINKKSIIEELEYYSICYLKQELEKDFSSINWHYPRIAINYRVKLDQEDINIQDVIEIKTLNSKVITDIPNSKELSKGMFNLVKGVYFDNTDETLHISDEQLKKEILSKFSINNGIDLIPAISYLSYGWAKNITLNLENGEIKEILFYTVIEPLKINTFLNCPDVAEYQVKAGLDSGEFDLNSLKDEAKKELIDHIFYEINIQRAKNNREEFLKVSVNDVTFYIDTDLLKTENEIFITNRPDFATNKHKIVINNPDKACQKTRIDYKVTIKIQAIKLKEKFPEITYKVIAERLGTTEQVIKNIFSKKSKVTLVT